MFKKDKERPSDVVFEAGGQKPKSGPKRLFINVLVTLIFGAISFYFTLPAINLQNPGFYSFAFSLVVVYCITSLITTGLIKENDAKVLWPKMKKTLFTPFVAGAIIIVFCAIGGVLSSVIFRAGSYKELLTVTQSDFVADVEEVSFDKIPMLDKDSAAQLGERKLGELSDMVSQFEVASNYTQINYNGRPVRVTPLVYGDLIKWFNNRRDGLPAYLIIDMVTQNVEVVRLEEGMRYTTNEHFMRYLPRYLRVNYPTYMFAEPVFEIDDNGVPYWVCAKIEKTIGLFGGTDINGAVLVNAVTGEHEYLEDAPTWVDHLYGADLIMQQYDYYGMYQNGYINSFLGQRGVTNTTDGYNYIAAGDDVYVYTGITSVGSDESNIGFILTNQRTKETTFYSIAGATEESARASAQGVVQHLGYEATFPLLLNIHDQPTYFAALKDRAGLVKMYAMVNVQQYQIVATGANIEECLAEYLRLLQQNNIADSGTAGGSTLSAQGNVSEIRSVVVEGNTIFYIRLQGSESYYVISAAANASVAVLNVGDRVTVHYYDASAGGAAIYTASAIEWNTPAREEVQQDTHEDASNGEPQDVSDVSINGGEDSSGEADSSSEDDSSQSAA